MSEQETNNAVNREERDMLIRALQKIDHLQATIDDMKAEMVTKARFEPIEKLVYGLVGLVLAGVVTALIALVINAP